MAATKRKSSLKSRPAAARQASTTLSQTARAIADVAESVQRRSSSAGDVRNRRPGAGKKLSKSEKALVGKLKQARKLVVGYRAARHGRPQELDEALKTTLPKLAAQVAREQVQLRTASRKAVQKARQVAERARTKAERLAKKARQEEEKPAARAKKAAAKTSGKAKGKTAKAKKAGSRARSATARKTK